MNGMILAAKLDAIDEATLAHGLEHARSHIAAGVFSTHATQVRA